MTTNGFSGLDPCVHCGFCLQACPTYLATGDEADGPRGRIVLMRNLARRQLTPADDRLGYHIDRCLGCQACETVCPSGVSYAPALEATRELLAEQRPIPLVSRALNRIMAEPPLRTPISWLVRRVRPVSRAFAGKSRVGFAFGMLAATHVRPRTTQVPATTGGGTGAPATDGVATIFVGCIMEGLFPHVHAACARTLAANDYRIVATPNQSCCGALHAHAGQHEEAKRLARNNVAAFAANPDVRIAVDSAGCGAMLKNYGRLLADDPLEQDAIAFAQRVSDVTELLAERGPKPGANMRMRVTYDPPCHLMHAQQVTEAPLAVLDAIPGMEKVAHAEAEMCCGSAGSYSLTEPHLSQVVLNRKIRSLEATSPELVATGNPGCIMQIGAGLIAAGSKARVVHPVEILDWSYERAGYYAE
ncbi:MAG: (Fe-S)-binding protein [Gemmatimonadales bacterium]